MSAMPTIRRFPRCRLDMYSREHGVPHFHLIANDGRRAAYAIGAQTRLTGAIDARDSREALDWAAAQAALLLKKWMELNA